uniref:Uncharacterized protein n=1 Tax=Romanomermis culicivorax TaxID=13658 RepID=A0A915KHG5_ROMCU
MSNDQSFKLASFAVGLNPTSLEGSEKICIIGKNWKTGSFLRLTKFYTSFDSMSKKTGSLETFLAKEDRQKTSAEIVKDAKLVMSNIAICNDTLRRNSARSINSARRPMTGSLEDATLLVSKRIELFRHFMHQLINFDN